MAKGKSTSAPSQPDYGTNPTSTGGKSYAPPGSYNAGKNARPPSEYGKQTQLGYEIGAPSQGLAPIGMVGSDPWQGNTGLQSEMTRLLGGQGATQSVTPQAGHQYTPMNQRSPEVQAAWRKANFGGSQARAMETAAALRNSGQGWQGGQNNMGGGSVSFPQAAAGGVPGQNSRQGYDENGIYIDNGPGNYDVNGNPLYQNQVAAEAQWAGMDSSPAGAPVNIMGVMYQPMKRADGSTYNQPVDANGNPIEGNTTRTDMGI